MIKEYPMLLSELEIENVLLYVADAVRFDSLHDQVSSLGTVYKTISQSIHTPPSFASIFTGCIPPRHGVYWFRDQLPEVDSVLTLPDHNCVFVHTATELERTDGGLLASALNAGSASQIRLSDIEEPFVWAERAPGGHAPYGREPKSNAREYFEELLPASEGEIKREYQGGIKRDFSVFQDRLETLESRGILKDTLIIYASDHGDMLGEHGIVGHNGPILPEVVYTPTVFVHPSLSAQRGGVMRNVDIFPTIRNVLGYEPLDYINGVPVHELEAPIQGTVHYCHGFDYGSNIGTDLGRFESVVDPKYDQHGLFDRTGGRVIRFNSSISQLGIIGGNLALSSIRSQYRHNAGKMAQKFMKRRWTCGFPRLDWETAEAEIVRTRDADRIGEISTLGVDNEQLEALGYI